MLPYLHGQDLFDYVDGSLPPPPKLSSDLSPNPAYKKWFKQDQQLLCALISSLFDSLIAQVVNYNTSHALWTALDTFFASQSQARQMQLFYQLATLKRGSDSISDYF